MHLGYDKNAALGTFTSLHNGNTTGTLWKSEGDQQSENSIIPMMLRIELLLETSRSMCLEVGVTLFSTPVRTLILRCRI